MYVKNSRGPSTEPCGTPEITGAGKDDLPFTTTFCARRWSYHIGEWSINVRMRNKQLVAEMEGWKYGSMEG